MLIILFVVMLTIMVNALFSENLPKRYHSCLLWLYVIVFVVISVTRPTSYVSDYKNYEKYFYSFDKKLTQLAVEQTFLIISEFVYRHGGTMKSVIYIFAFISIPLKLYSVRKMTDETCFLLSILVYASNYFMLHDCEQIRLAAGMAFGMYALYLRVERRSAWLIAGLLAVGIAFHHTLAVLAFPLLMSPKDLSARYKTVLALIVPVSVLLWVAHINIITSLPIPYIEQKLALYEYAIANGEHPDIRVINIMVLFRIALFYYVIYYYDVIKPHIKALPMLLLCDCFSLAAWFGLSEMSVIAVRISQLFGFVEIILFASVYYTIRPAWCGKVIVMLLATYFFAQNYVYNQFGFR